MEFNLGIPDLNINISNVEFAQVQIPDLNINPNDASNNFLIDLITEPLIEDDQQMEGTVEDDVQVEKLGKMMNKWKDHKNNHNQT